MTISAASVTARTKEVVGELDRLFAALDPDQVQRLATRLSAARRVFFSAQGRSLLMVKAVAIRLMHIGLDVFVAGETNTPAIEAPDLLVAVSASAKTGVTLSHVATAKKVGAATVLVTTSADLSLADHVVRLPIRSDVPTTQHAGSLFEQGVLILGDAVAYCVQTQRGIPEATLNARHANLQ